MRLRLHDLDLSGKQAPNYKGNGAVGIVDQNARYIINQYPPCSVRVFVLQLHVRRWNSFVFKVS